MTIGIIGAGYYEGVDVRLSNKGFVKIGPYYCSIIGKVSMNLTTIDISDIPNVTVGTKVMVYSHIGNDSNSIMNSATRIDASVYNLVTGINQSIKRVVI